LARPIRIGALDIFTTGASRFDLRAAFERHDLRLGRDDCRRFAELIVWRTSPANSG
jgi:hypothetical protein